MPTVAETPHSLTDANALLDNPEFTAPSGPWPAGSFVHIGGGTSGNPVTEAHWDDVAGAFTPGPVPDDPLDLTEAVLKSMPDLADSLAELKVSTTHGDGRLSAAQAELFDTGTFVLLPDGKAYYDSGQDGTPPTGGSTGTWQTGASPATAPVKLTGVVAGTPGDWLPATADGPVSLTYANALVASSPANGFSKPTAAWTTGQYVVLEDNTTHIHWDHSTQLFATGPVP